MSEISLKSITGITSITTPTGVDNQLTVHNNNTTEAVKLDNAGNVHINNQLEVSGVSTFAGITTNTSTLFANQLSVAGVSSFSGNLHSSGKLTINPDDNTTTWKRENKNMHQIRDDVYVEGTVNVGDKAGFDATPLGITTFTWVSAGTSYYSLTTNVAHAIPQGTNILIKDSVSGFQEAYNTTSGAGTTITVERALDPSSELSVANTKVVVYTPADPRGCLNVAKNYAKVIENGFNPILRGFVGSSTTHPVGINTEVFKIEIKRDGTEEDSVATLLHSTRQMGSKQRLALTIDDGKSYPQGKNLVLTQTGVKINADDSAFSDANALLEVDGNVAIGITTPGKLGIGTHNPLTLLHLKSDDPTFRIQRHNQSAYGEITVDTAGKITLKSDPGNAANGDGFSFTVNNSEKVGISSDGTVTATAFAPTSEQLSHRNIAINGDMKVAQRGTSTTSVSASGYYACDRMRTYCYVGSERYTVSQVAEAPTGSGFTKSFKIQTTTADTSANAGTFLTFQYSIEGQDVQHLLKGTSSAKPITLSFWVKGNTNYTPVAELRDDNSRLNVQTFNVTSSWTKIVLTYVGDTTGTIDDDNTSGLSLNIWLKASAFYSGGTSPAQNTWVPQSNHNIRAALLTFDIAASTSNYFQITGLQIEVGSIATPFEHRSFGDELSRCQRYFQRVEGHSDMVCAGPGRSNGTTNAPFTIPLSVPLRASPTVNACAWAIFTSNNQANSASQTPAVTKWDAYNNVLTCQLAGLSGMTNARALNVFINSSNTFTMDAEL